VSVHGGLVHPLRSTISVGSPKWFHDAFAPKIDRLRRLLGLLEDHADGIEAVETDARVSGLVWIASLCSQ
jgi:hypothetical protein